jgi:trans-aconitate methyltransferase
MSSSQKRSENGDCSPQSKSSWDAALYEDAHSFVWKQAASLVELLAPRAGERILDLGCGTGHLTAQLAAAGAEVVGIDSSATMIAEARRLYPPLPFELADARDFAFAEPFDAVFSNAALHWILEAEQVIACVRRALKPGGRFVAEFGGHGNVRNIVAAMTDTCVALGITMLHPLWYFPSIAEYTGLLERGGLEPTYAILFDRPTPLEGADGMRRWLSMFAQPVLSRVPAEKQDTFFRHVEERLHPLLCRDGAWYADYRRIRIVAWRNGGQSRDC